MAKNMAKKDECCGACGTCGMHLCRKCTLPMAFFGLLFIIVGTNMVPTAAPWFTGWTVFGVMLAVMALFGMMKKY